MHTHPFPEPEADLMNRKNIVHLVLLTKIRGDFSQKCESCVVYGHVYHHAVLPFSAMALLNYTTATC